MAECPYFEHLLVIPRLRVQNANAISSPLTHGLPSITAFLGLMWALERKTQAAGLDLQLNAVGVVVHRHQELITEDRFVSAFRLTRNPIDKDGSTAAIVEEGRIHLELSLIFAVQSPSLTETDQTLPEQVRELLMSMRIAGGTLIQSSAPRSRQVPYCLSLPNDEAEREQLFKRVRLRLLPGFALVERPDLLEQRHAALREIDPEASRLDAWLSLSRINWQYDATEAKWWHDRQGRGWIVPIPVGYGALSGVQAPGTVVHARDDRTPFRFVESLYSIGEWLSPHRLDNPRQLLWYADTQADEGVYRCRNDFQPPQLAD
ncbi:type I-F CRISPR-associated protein Csy2 [Pseudomonas lopnurensis]|uniref:type I-F CRISPR-associated protein Csy2 n=1 Tax=Pseudomonas lopnurensis TaxID=1477517 RepID=UPI0028A76A6E|nr:type I-F CRISPR-associated protein Csy2 [Pseudomonas lopnurensis]